MFGSFVASTVFRLGNEKSLLTIRSYCPHCKKTISWYYNIPLFSYLWLKAKTKCCNSSIPIFYPFIESATAVIFFINWAYFEYNDLVLISILSVILIIIFFVDYYYFIIHDALLILFLLFTITSLFYYQLNPFNVSFISAVQCSIFSMLIFWSIGKIFLIIRKTEGLGFGDVKLIGIISLWTGFSVLPILIIMASIFAIIHIFINSKLFFKKVKLVDLKAPFGSYLSISLLILIYLI